MACSYLFSYLARYFIRSSQVLLPQLRACHQLWPLLFSHLLRLIRAETPQLGLRKRAAGRGEGPSLQHTQLSWECGRHPLTLSPFFPPLPPDELGCPPTHVHFQLPPLSQ